MERSRLCRAEQVLRFRGIAAAYQQKHGRSIFEAP